MSDYDMSIHTNPDAMAWVAFFRQTHPNCNVPDDVMLGWFANSMMAMHDWLGHKMDAEIERLRKALEQYEAQPDQEYIWARLTPLAMEELAAYLRERDSRPPTVGEER